MRSLFYTVTLLLIIFYSCGPAIQEIATNNANYNLDTSKMTQARVIDYSDLDGCSFILELDDGSKLQPLVLPEEFKKNGITVYVTFSFVKQPGVCMVGKIIEIDKITISEK